MAASPDFAELSSLRAQVDDVVARVVAVGDRYRESDDSALVAELDQAERLLVNAIRSLERATGLVADPH